MFYWNTKTKYKKKIKQKKTNSKTKVVVDAYISRKKKKGYIIPTMNCCLRNG